MAALWCVALHGAARTNVYEFKKTIPAPGSIQWELNQRLAKERQELYRKRMDLPDAVGTDVPVAARAYLAFDRKPVASAPAAPALSGMLFRLFFFTVMLLFGGFFLARRFAPRVLDRISARFNWAFAPAAGRILPGKIRTEDQAFAEFLAEFRIGPAAPASVQSPGLLGEFFVRAAGLLDGQRTLLREIVRESGDLARQKMLADLRAGMGRLKDEAAFPETLPVWQTASVLEGLLRQLAEKTGNVTPSALRTVAGGVDLLRDLCAPGLKPDCLAGRSLKFLVVDDDLISRQALSHSLGKAFGRPDLAVDGETALFLVNQQAYDVIFLDVQMPGMDGYEVCLQIRDTALNSLTPVVFVSSQYDFTARARSTLAGGNDLFGKPFLTFEIAVKALTLALAGRLRGALNALPGQELAGELASAAAGSSLVSRPLLAQPAVQESQFVRAFLVRAAAQLGPLRELCRIIQQTPEVGTRQTLLASGFLRVNSLTSQAAPPVVHPGHQLCGALEGLFRKLLENPNNYSASTFASVVSAVELLADLCVPGLPAEFAAGPPVRLLVVDDDLIARRALAGILQTSFEKPESVESGEAALALTAEQPFDVIFLDVIMPGMDGFEACAKIRASGPNRETPVVFVTSQADDHARGQMIRCGGNDLLGKPFLTSEITVKALTFALRGRLGRLKAPVGGLAG